MWVREMKTSRLLASTFLAAISTLAVAAAGNRSANAMTDLPGAAPKSILGTGQIGDETRGSETGIATIQANGTVLAISDRRRADVARVTRGDACYIDGPSQGRPPDLFLTPGETVSLLPDIVGGFRRIETGAGVKCWTSQDAIDRREAN